MICPICKTGSLKPGHTTVALTRDSVAVVLKEVPADICDWCGEYYLAADVTSRTLAKATATKVIG